MSSEEGEQKKRENGQEYFNFPVLPYSIQVNLMETLYNSLSNKLLIVESPTGTGKSLSMCCGSLRWLQNYNLQQIDELSTNLRQLKNEVLKQDEDNSSDWIAVEYDKITLNTRVQTLLKRLNKINERNEKIKKLKERKTETESKSNHWKRFNSDKNSLKDSDPIQSEDIKIENNELDDDALIIDEIKNINEDEEELETEEVDEQEEDSLTKIFFCSRTHSQLSQFVNEIKKTKYSSEMTVISLASRQHYCINPAVQRLNNPSLINERCLELQKNKKGKATKIENGNTVKKAKCSSGCPFLNSTKVDLLKDETLSEVMDIEDIVTAAKKIQACPYYATRAALKYAQVVVLPYQSLLHEATRKANGVIIKDNIVIIDEAHNLLDTIENIYSAEINGFQLEVASNKLKQYKEKYHTRFSAKNLLSLNQIVYIVNKLLDFLKVKKDLQAENKVFFLEEFVAAVGIDHYNFVPLLNFCIRSKLAQKLFGFVEKYNNVPDTPLKPNNGIEEFLTKMSEEKNKKSKQKIEPEIISHVHESQKENLPHLGNVIQKLVNFLQMLTTSYSDGRICMIRNSDLSRSNYKFILLNPASQFESIVKDAKSIVVAGGTMQPFSEFRNQLFVSSGGDPQRIMEFSCDHVIPQENILTGCLSQGPSGKILNFSYESRNSPELLNEFGRVLQNICNIVPGGVICFFTSYDYEKLIYKHLQDNGTLSRIQSKKNIFREPKTSSEVDKVLEEYGKAIKKSNTTLTGALLFSVVGGKLSEGLNFSDDLGRCVMVVGMPYPNMKSIELQEKIKYLNKNDSSITGNQYYENLCMKAVNQCIGRAVRHANDYSTVVLIDERYSRDRISNALPKWIQKSLMTNAKFGQIFGAINKFFAFHKQKNKKAD